MDTASPLRPEPQGAAGPIPTTGWKRRALIVAVVGFLASGLVIAASFMPWFSAESGHALRLSDGSLVPTVSGWDIFESERNAGELGLVAHGPFAFASGDPAFYLTGLATLISGLSLAGLTVVFIALGALSPRFQRRRSTTILLMLVASTLMILMVVVVALPPWSVAMVYFQHGAPTHASLEYGPILLCAASVVGFIAMMLSLTTRSEEVRNARQAERQRRLTVAHRH